MSEGKAVSVYEESGKALTVEQIREQVNLIQKVMKSFMKEGVHFGKIPGCPKPSLWKPGAEKIATTFRISVGTSSVENLSTDDFVKFKVTATAMYGDKFIGSSTGICSSNEEKYRWKKPTCSEEWDEYPEDRKREKWIKEHWKDGKKVPAQKIKQIRTEPADLENTILQMADKRAYVAVVRKVTAASDVFTQDIEDLPEEMRSNPEGEQTPSKPEVGKPALKKEPAKKESASKNNQAGQNSEQQISDEEAKAKGYISQKQLNRLLAIANKNGYSADDVDSYLTWEFPHIEGKRMIPYKEYDKIVNFFETNKKKQ
jgi:hypothetical protein